MQTATLELSRTDIEHLPHFRRKTASEYSSACPFCGQGEDRFIFWPKAGNYWCRQCGITGRVVGFNGKVQTPDIEEIDKTDEQKLRYAMYIMQQSQHLPEHYHELLTPERRKHWYAYGLTDGTIDKNLLGYSPICPTYHNSASLTIPIFYKGKVVSIRHRLLNPPDKGKYRPQVAGLPAVIFGADLLLERPEYIVLVEGEVKAIVLRDEYNIRAVGIPGACFFKDEWIKLFSLPEHVVIVFDPCANHHAMDIVRKLPPGRAYFIPPPEGKKPDDYLVLHNGTRESLIDWINHFLGVVGSRWRME